MMQCYMNIKSNFKGFAETESFPEHSSTKSPEALPRNTPSFNLNIIGALRSLPFRDYSRQWSSRNRGFYVGGSMKSWDSCEPHVPGKKERVRHQVRLKSHNFTKHCMRSSRVIKKYLLFELQHNFNLQGIYQALAQPSFRSRAQHDYAKTVPDSFWHDMHAATRRATRYIAMEE